MVFTKLFKQAEGILVENSAAILTGVGITGAVTTAVLSGRAGFKAAQTIDQDLVRRVGEAATKASEDGVLEDVDELTTKEKVMMTWAEFIPPVGAGITTVTAIFFAHQLATKKTAALAAAYGISEKAFQEYKEKVVEKFGEKKEIALQDELQQDRVNAAPVEDRTVIITGDGDVLCFDSLTGRYFQSTIEKIKKAENKINFNIIHHSSASLSEFYDEIGLPPSAYSEQVGWNLDNTLDVKYSTTKSTDGRPCIAIDFHFPPVPDYDRAMY